MTLSVRPSFGWPVGWSVRFQVSLQMLLSELLFKIKIKYNAMSENYHYQTPLRNSFICMDDLVGEYSVD